MNYKSPIEVFYSDVQLQFEDNVYKAVQAVDIHVDRDELIKALQYDRQQYEKGWHDALLKGQTSVKPVKSKLSWEHGYNWDIWDCGHCGSQLRSDANYCNRCGHKVNWDDMEENDA